MIFVIILAVFILACLFLGGLLLLAAAGFLALTAWAIFWAIVLAALFACLGTWAVWWCFNPKAASTALKEEMARQDAERLRRRAERLAAR